MNATATPAYEWKDLPWKTIQRRVFKLQTRIYRASGRGDVGTVHRLQRLMLKSWSARCLAVRRVTQDNRGKKTAGIDGVASMTPRQRMRLVRTLDLNRKVRPLRRVWIPKPHASEQRALGIPVLHDRAAQALVKLALEPEWEAKFEPNSYGFRPGRSTRDAIGAIFQSTCHKDKYVLDADIRKCFDRIRHDALLAKLSTFSAVRRVIRGWLRAGVMEGKELFPTEAGTPQGGVVSPLLANVALHGMELYLWGRFPQAPPTVIRYADDVVVLHPERATVEAAQQALSEWLSRMGLELKPEKTRIGHTLYKEGARPGFDFLGFTVRQFPVGKHHAARNRGGLLGWKLLITPSKAAGMDHQRKLKAVIRKHRSAPQAALIAELNPKIRGWSLYYRAVVSARAFKRQDHLTYLKLRRWGKRRHHNGRAWRRYFGPDWRFQANGATLCKHADCRIQRHVKVQGRRSPFDGDWVYWSSRTGSSPEMAPQVARLLRRQKGKCAFCGLYFQVGDLLENDHIVPKHLGGSNHDTNRQLLHRHCHDTKGAHDKGQVTEEPCTGKLVRTVLHERRAGRPARRL